MKKKIILLFFTISLVSCGQITTGNIDKNTKMTLTIDTNIIAVLPFNNAYYWIFKEGKQIDLTSKDLLDLENLLKKCINENNLLQEKKFNELNSDPECVYKYIREDFIIDLKNYKRQYVAVISSNGEKEVWVNCFCSSFNSYVQNWREEIIVVQDGGNCYFNLKINLTKGEYYDFMINGVA